MTQREEDLAFARFRAAKDPADLARVFDLTAGSLLLVAMHLTRNETDAEDLLQATFLTAIDAAHRYDPARPVLAWLTGILTLEARMAGRRSRRALPAELSQREEPGPVQAAERQELAEDLAAAIQGIPDTYRTVLMLRFVHGLRSVQIARSLNRSPETVRTQVRRGLELLRNALPKGLAIPAVLLLAGSRGLAAVRGEVIAKAAALHVPLATASVLGGVLLMKTTISILLVVALGGVLAFIGWFGGSAPAESDPTDRLAVAPAVAEGLHSRTAAAASEPATERRSRAAGSAQDAGDRARPSEPLAILRGRCVALEDGAPLAGCTVSLQDEGSSWKRKADADARAWRAPEPVVTGADGTFRLGFVAPDELRLRVEIRGAGRVPLSETCEGYARDADVDLGNVRLWAGSAVTGSVVDPNGSPVARVTVRIPIERLNLDGGPIDRLKQPDGRPDAPVVLSARSTEDGRLAFPDLVPAGIWPVELEAAEGFALARPVAARVVAGKAVSDLVVVVRASSLPLITGWLVDDLGRPVRGVVHARMLGTTGFPSDLELPGITRGPGIPLSTAQTDQDGAFALAPSGPVFAGTASIAENVRLLCQVDGWLHDFGARMFAWGTKDVKFVVPNPPRSSAEITVVAADGGKPVEEYALRSCLDHMTEDIARKPWADQWFPCARRPDGRTLVADLVPGNRILFVIPKDPALHPSGAVLFTSSAGAVAQVRVELQRSVEYRVRAAYPDGSPVVAAKAELIRSWGRGDTEPAWSVPVPLDEVITCPYGRRTCWLVDRGTTDVEGSVQLRGPAALEGVRLRLSAGPAASLHDLVALRSEGGVLTVVVPVGATLRGSVRPAGLIPTLDARTGIERATKPGPGLKLRRWEGGSGSPLPGGGRSFAVAEDGSFRIDGLPPGSFEWYVDLPNTTSPCCSGRFALAEGETKELDLDLRSFIPGRIKGRIRLNGEPLVNASWAFSLFMGSGEKRWQSTIQGRPFTDSEGRFELRFANPGRYQLKVQTRDPETGGPLTFEDPDWIEVGPGAEVERTFELQRRTLRVLVTESDGKTPVRRTRVMAWDQETKAGLKELLTDDAGVILLDPAPHAPIELGVFRAKDDRFSVLGFMLRPDWTELVKRLRVLGTAACPPGSEEAEVRLALPDVKG